jgi:large subunit ribosomal protein L16
MRRQPKRTKFRKQFKGSLHGMDRLSGDGLSTLKFGPIGLISLEPARLTARQLEASRRVRRYHLKRAGKVWMRVFPDIPVTAKPLEVRMGKGKGSVDYWACKVRPGTVRFEVDGVDLARARYALGCAGKKFPMKVTCLQRPLPQSRPGQEDVKGTR